MIASQMPAKLVATVPPSEGQNKGELMTRILLLGPDPETVDFSDPALPPGMTAEKVRAGIAVALKQFTRRGWESDVGFIRPDETAGPTAQRQLRSTTIVWSSEAACACRPATLHYSKSSSTLFVRLPQARRLSSIHGPTIALMLPPDGWRLEAELYSPASNKTSSPPQARRVLRLSELRAVRLVIKGSRPPALDATASSSAAGQSEAKNCPRFVAQNRPGRRDRNDRDAKKRTNDAQKTKSQRVSHPEPSQPFKDAPRAVKRSLPRYTHSRMVGGTVGFRVPPESER